MNILITGSNGFIAKNLIVKLKEKKYNILEFKRGDSLKLLRENIIKSNIIFHLAGENRSNKDQLFIKNNVLLTKNICDILKNEKLETPVLFSSSIHSDRLTVYGKSKKRAEILLNDLCKENNNPVKIYSLPGVFGKWSKPFYNSVVATFCHSITRDLEINIMEPEKLIKLIYVDDLISDFLNSIENIQFGFKRTEVNPQYEISVKELANTLLNFKSYRENLLTDKVGEGLIRKLYATFLTYLPIEKSSYEIAEYKDERGRFVEMLKTKDSGQFSFFTAQPGVIRGGHYHHSKSEKFLVLKGRAKFRIVNILTKEYKEIYLSADKPKIIESIPGWSHDIKNIGNDELIVMLWANEIFDKKNPDTFMFEI